MNIEKPTTDSAEILNRIDRFTHDADWSIEELHESLRAKGIDPGLALKNIKSRLAPLYQFKKSPDEFSGIVAAAEKLGFGLNGLADLTDWSEIFILKLDRRLIAVEGRAQGIASILAEKLKSAVEPIQDYILGQSLYPAEANFKSDAQPEIPNKQSFEEAIDSDPIMMEDTKSFLLSLKDDE